MKLHPKASPCILSNSVFRCLESPNNGAPMTAAFPKLINSGRFEAAPCS